LQDVSQAALYVAAKMQDTIKKPQDILEIGYTVRYPHMVNNVTGVADIDADVSKFYSLYSRLLTRIYSEKQVIEESYWRSND